jgi:hypothetical protein
MNEEEWLTAQHSATLLHFIAPKVSDRKLHYFAIACARRLAPILPEPASLQGIDVLERFVEGQCNEESVHAFSYDVEGAAFSVEAGHAPWQGVVEQLPHNLLAELAANPDCTVESARRILTSAAYFVDEVFSTVPWERRFPDWVSIPGGSLFRPVWLVHEIFGNPFRQVKMPRKWRTSTAVALARQVYDSRDFGAMLILADALQDAGCDNEDILAHCRGASLTHVRGCWVVDLVLGKS